MTNRKIMLAAAATTLASAFLTPAWPALATPGSGNSGTALVNGHFGEIDVKQDKIDKWDLTVRTKGETDIGTDRITLQPGGYTGWHAHPAPVFVTVTQGTIQWYNGRDPICGWHTYTVGQSYIEPALNPHNVRNATGEVAQYIAVRMNPTGVPFRIDEPQPTNC